ncbi:MAG: hypothetical protein ACI4VT_04640 [Bacilli bacterium]
MNLVENFLFLFFLGSTVGWIIELFYRKIIHGRWNNPGFLHGPYLPIYGFGLCLLTLIYYLFNKYNLPAYLSIITMTISMVLIELIGGLMFINTPKKLWDYSNEWGNYKGVICPLYSLIWALVSVLYYFLLGDKILKIINYITIHNNPLIYILLLCFYIMIFVDVIRSFKHLKALCKEIKLNL